MGVPIAKKSMNGRKVHENIYINERTVNKILLKLIFQSQLHQRSLST